MIRRREVYSRAVRTNIDIDDELLRQAAALLGTKSKKGTVEAALKEVLRQQAMRNLLDLRIDMDMDDVRPGWEPSQRTRENSA
jgi:Arc/MetJ family transcription regulator